MLPTKIELSMKHIKQYLSFNPMFKIKKKNYMFSLCSPRLFLTRSLQISGQNKSEARELERLVKITYGFWRIEIFGLAGNSNSEKKLNCVLYDVSPLPLPKQIY